MKLRAFMSRMVDMGIWTHKPIAIMEHARQHNVETMREFILNAVVSVVKWPMSEGKTSPPTHTIMDRFCNPPSHGINHSSPESPCHNLPYKQLRHLPKKKPK